MVIARKVLIAFVLLLVGLPIVVQVLGHTFLLSPEWASQSGKATLVVTLAIILLLLVAVFTAKVEGPETILGRPIAVLGAIFLGLFAGRNLALIAGPMAITLIAGRQVEHTFTVTDSDHIGSRGCRKPVGLEGLPFLLDRLCGVPDELRKQLFPGARIIVTGLGSSSGVYASKVRLAE